MYILSVVPLARLPRSAPQVLSYTNTDLLPKGALVRISIGNRKTNAIVILSRPLSEIKGTIKRLPYQLKPIDTTLSINPILFPWQINLARWVSLHFYEPLSLVIRTMIPDTFERRKTAPKFSIAKILETQTKGSFNFITEPRKERLAYYNKIITKSPATLILTPDQRTRNALAEELGIPIFDVSLKSSALLEQWNAIRSGKTKAIVGTRSAIMVPFPHLDHLIIENESSDHHASWDQHPKIDLRRIAEWLATQTTTVTIGDPFPTLERTLRYGISIQPITINVSTQLVDLRTAERDERAPTFSHTLAEAIDQTLSEYNRVLLYVARRGVATFILCQDCGFHIECPHCSVPLVLHNKNGIEMLRCHHCGHKQEPIIECSSCNSPNIRYAGIGTQRVEQEIQQRFPSAPLLRLDADTIQQNNGVKSFEHGILLGTDLLLSHPNLPTVDLSVAVSIETLLHLPTYTATERIIRTLLRLRLHSRRRFIVQTYTPDASAISAVINNAITSTIKTEDKSRKNHKYPPYSQLILCQLRKANGKNGHTEGQILRERLIQQCKSLEINDDVDILGPAPAFIEREQNQSREHLLIKWKLNAPIFTLDNKNRILRKRILDIIPPEWEIIIDPVSLL